MENNNLTIKISIIIPVYNSQDYITNMLDSIPLRNDIEVIVVNDCSTDKSLDILESYTRMSLNIINLNENRGPGNARNIGLQNAIGDYIFFADSDDILCTNTINTFIDNLNYDYDLHTGRCIFNSGKISPLVTAKTAANSLNYSFIRRQLALSAVHPTKYNGEDSQYAMQLLSKNPTTNFTDEIFFHYNYPRVGSLSWGHTHNYKRRK